MRVPRSSTTEPARTIECSISERQITHVLADRGVGADVGVLDPRAGADHGRAADDRAAHLRAGLDHDPSLDLRVGVDLALEAGLDLLQHEAVGLEHVGELAGVLPPAADHLRLHLVAVLDQALDRLGDLQLAAPGGLQGAGGLEDRRAEEVDADQGEVRRRVFRLLDQAHDALAVELGDAVVLGSSTGVSRISASGSDSRKVATRPRRPSASRLSPRYMTKGEPPMNSSAVSTAWASPAGLSWTM